MKTRALTILVASLALVLDSACSHAPAPDSSPQPVSSAAEISSRLRLYEANKAVIRVHTKDGTIIPTSRYSFDDSTVVIGEVLRGREYTPEVAEAHLNGKPSAQELPENVTIPLTVRMDQIVALERWGFPPREATGSEVGPRVAVYAAEKVTARIHTADGTIIPTSRYALVDSTVVINNVLRGDQYFPEMQPRLNDAQVTVKQLPKGVTLPLRVPLSEVATVDRWQDPQTGRKGIVTGLWVAASVAFVGWLVASFDY